MTKIQVGSRPTSLIRPDSSSSMTVSPPFGETHLFRTGGGAR